VKGMLRGGSGGLFLRCIRVGCETAGMRISAKADYAVRALLEMAKDNQGPVTAERLADAQGIPRGFLLAILAEMRRGGLVHSQRGQAGGWLLARDPAAISVADVIRVVEGPLASVHGQRPEEVDYDDGAGGLQQVWVAVRASLREVLENVTVADLAAGRLPREVTRRSAVGDAWLPH
jgi:Rrf2 family protein